MTGLKEELVGKVTKKPDLAEVRFPLSQFPKSSSTYTYDFLQHGHDLRTGALKHKEQEEADKASPFSAAKEDPSSTSTSNTDTNEINPKQRTAGQEEGVFTEGDQPGKRLGEERVGGIKGDF